MQVISRFGHGRPLALLTALTFVDDFRQKVTPLSGGAYELRVQFALYSSSKNEWRICTALIGPLSPVSRRLICGPFYTTVSGHDFKSLCIEGD